jgi:hypothetical protein
MSDSLADLLAGQNGQVANFSLLETLATWL